MAELHIKATVNLSEEEIIKLIAKLNDVIDMIEQRKLGGTHLKYKQG